MNAAQAAFDELSANRHLSVQGTHWAALINAWGCVCRDLDCAIAAFESIPSHPSSRRSTTIQPDAVVFESLINVFVTLHRMDLVNVYLKRLQDSGIHVTAYIMNLLIKGYAASGDMGKAREIFESLRDPETGVAAPNNHLPHDATLIPASTEVIYREVSSFSFLCDIARLLVEPSSTAFHLGSNGTGRTWLRRTRQGNTASHSHGGQVCRLLPLKHTAYADRIHRRMFPPAVTSRIRGIMRDISVTPA